VKTFRDMRRASGRVFRTRYTMGFLEHIVDEALDARELPAMGGMKSDFDANPSEPA
jgi:hypothetical protein